MTIKIAIPSTKITPGQIEDIVFHFNHMKPLYLGTLESLQKSEGGFAIIPLPSTTTTKKHKSIARAKRSKLRNAKHDNTETHKKQGTNKMQ